MRESAKVQSLHEPPVEKVVATGFNLVINLAGERQITFQSGYEGDETDEAVHARIDRMMAIGDRYKARYSIPDIEDDLAQQRQTLDNLIVDKARLDLEYEVEQGARREELEKCKLIANEHIFDLGNERSKIENEARAAHDASGRRGNYNPAGHIKANLDKYDLARTNAGIERDKAVAEIQATIDKAAAERQRAEDNQAISIERWTKAITDTEAKLARMKALAGG